MRVVFYNSPKQKLDAKEAANLRGESTKHNDFVNELGEETNGKTGRLTFWKKPKTPPRVIKGLNELNQRLKDKRIQYLELLDLLEIQALKLNSTRWENFKALFGR